MATSPVFGLPGWSVWRRLATRSVMPDRFSTTTITNSQNKEIPYNNNSGELHHADTQLAGSSTRYRVGRGADVRGTMPTATRTSGGVVVRPLEAAYENFSVTQSSLTVNRNIPRAPVTVTLLH